MEPAFKQPVRFSAKNTYSKTIMKPKTILETANVQKQVHKKYRTIVMNYII